MEVLHSTAGSWERTDRPYMRISRREPVSRPTHSDYDFYRRLIYLKNNIRIMLRFLHEKDRQDLIDLFQKASAEDLWFFKHDLHDQGLLNFWLNHVSYQRHLPLVAINLDNNQLIAAATVLRGDYTAHHIGEIKLFIAKPFRNLGLGSKILDEIIQVAYREKLHWLKAEVVTDQKQMIKALRNKGFQIRATLEDFFTCQNGKTYDVVLMMLSLSSMRQEPF